MTENQLTRLNYKWIADLLLSGKTKKEIQQITGYKKVSVIAAIKSIQRQFKQSGGDNTLITSALNTVIQDSIRQNSTITSEYMTEFVRLQIELDSLTQEMQCNKEASPNDKDVKALKAKRDKVIDRMIKVSTAITNNYKNLLSPIIRMGVSSKDKPPKGTQYPDSSGSINSADLAYMEGYAKRFKGEDDKELDG